MKVKIIYLLILISGIGCQSDKVDNPNPRITNTTQAGSEEIYEFDEVDQAPRVIAQDTAQHMPSPVSQENPGEIVTVVVEFVITSNGTVENVSSESDVNEKAIEKAVSAVKKWKFEPAIKDGRPVNLRVQMSIPMRIETE